MQKVQHLLADFGADKVVLEDATGGDAVATGLVEFAVVVDPAGADHEDVAVLEGGVLGFGAREQFGEGDGMRGVGVVGLVVGLGVGPVVQQDASADLMSTIVRLRLDLRVLCGCSLTYAMISPSMKAASSPFQDLILGELTVSLAWFTRCEY